MSVRNFRLLVVALLLLTVGIVVSDNLTRSQLPEPLRAYLDSQDQADPEMNAQLLVLAFGAMVVAALALISSIGLLFLWRPARLLYTLSLALAYPMVLLMEPTIYTGLTEFLSELASLLSGVILALLYFSPLKTRFDPPPPLTA
jgi:hypothetical protein